MFLMDSVVRFLIENPASVDLSRSSKNYAKGQMDARQ